MLENYRDVVHLPLGREEEKEIAAAVTRLRAALKSYGVAPEAIDALKIDVSLNSLTISDEDSRTGASHIYADGKPFYSVKVSGPGYMNELMSYADAPLKSMPAAQQAQMLAFEMGLNLLPRTDEAVVALKAGVHVNGRLSALAHQPVFETQTRNDPAIFISTLEKLARLRLDMMAPKFMNNPGGNGPKL